MYNFRFLYLLLIVLSGWSCANIIPLEGGPRDTTPPKVLKVEPDSFKTRFIGNKISLYFDEFVTVKNASKEVFVSPPIQQKPELILRGKSVDIIIQDTLLANTTYIIQLGKAIADNNEGNILEGYSYVFSTGDVIDSLSLRFEVLDAFTLKPVNDVKIMLYNNTEDSLPYKQPPFYMGLTSSNGNALLKYLRSGDFKVFAIQDVNENLLYDKEVERIGFLEQRIVSGDTVRHKILLFKEAATSNKLRFARMLYPGKIAFKFAQPADKIIVEPLTDSLPKFTYSAEFVSQQHDSLIYWYRPITSDTLRFRLFINGEWDTIAVRQMKSSASREKGKRAIQPQSGNDENKLEVKLLSGKEHDYFLPFKIELNHPISKIDTSLIEIWEDKQQISYSLGFSDSIHRILAIYANWKEGKNYLVKFFKGAISDILELENDSSEISFTTTRSSDYVTLTLKIQQVQNTPSVILQWLKEDDTIFHEEVIPIDVEGKGIATYHQLPVGKYRIRMIYDANNNGSWDTGIYLQKIQPEKVSYFPQVIEVRKGFDLELEWDVTQEPAEAEGGRKSK